MSNDEPRADEDTPNEDRPLEPDQVDVEVYDFGPGGYEVVATEAQRAVRPKIHFWLSFFLPGAAFIVIGAAIMVWPQGSIQLLTTLLGVLVSFTGIMLVAGSINTRRVSGSWGMGLVPGIALIAVGAASILFASFIAQFWIFFWAAVAVLSGVWDVASAVMNDQGGRWIRLARGAVLAILGAAVLISPALKLGYLLLGLAIGIGCLLVGVSTIAIGLAARRAEL
jgi:uncharacterized membrane protein HdeD (DUF308 family)